MPIAKRRWTILCAALALAAATGCAHAHPHILISARGRILFDPQGRIIGVANVWDFDDAFSAYAIQGYDAKGDGNPTREDLQPFAEVNLKSLAEYGYFTQMRVDGAPIAFGAPKDYYDTFAAETLTLHFTLPLAAPLDPRGKSVEVDVYDPEYFAAISFANGDAVQLAGAKPGCVSAMHRPTPLDPAIASQLAVIPVDQRTLPPALFAVTDTLVNAVTVTCR